MHPRSAPVKSVDAREAGSVDTGAARQFKATTGAGTMTSSFRLSNAQAKCDLGWTPMAPTYRDGIALTAQALRQAA